MSFNVSKQNIGYAPGFFLASADCVRETIEVPANHTQVVTKADGSKFVPAGALLSKTTGTGNDAVTTYFGLLYEDVDVSTGNMPGSCVSAGTVYEDRLPASVSADAKTALKGITFIAAAPAITRPQF